MRLLPFKCSWGLLEAGVVIILLNIVERMMFVLLRYIPRFTRARKGTSR